MLEDSETERSQIHKNILRLQSEVYSQFEYETPTSNYTDLTSIAKHVKDTDGTLNISKLSTYIATKPKALEKYCDY